MLFAGCVAIVLIFKESSAMEAAYGLSITICMLMTSCLFAFYLYTRRVRLLWIGLYLAVYLTIEFSFLFANLVKFMHGGSAMVKVTAQRRGYEGRQRVTGRYRAGTAPRGPDQAPEAGGGRQDVEIGTGRVAGAQQVEADRPVHAQVGMVEIGAGVQDRDVGRNRLVDPRLAERRVHPPDAPELAEILVRRRIARPGRLSRWIDRKCPALAR
jgi:hypothetical protein